MAHMPEQINQDLYIERYLNGHTAPAAPGWMKELIDAPGLDAAEDLLESVIPSDRYIWSCGPLPQITTPPLHAPKRSAWRVVSDITFYAGLAAIVVGAFSSGGSLAGRALFLGVPYLVILVSIALRVCPGKRLIIGKGE